jgi:putative membrane protein
MDIKVEIEIKFTMNLLLRFLLNGLAVLATAYLLPNVEVTDYQTALLTALALSIANVVIKPLLIIFTIPITVMTLGLFLLVINSVIILLVDHFIPGFSVNGFWWALAFSLIMSIFNSIIDDILKEKKK